VFFFFLIFFSNTCFARVAPGDKAPDFSIRGTYKSVYSLKSLCDGKPLLLFFGKTNSERSTNFVKELIKLNKKVKNLSILCLMVNEGPMTVWKYITKMKADFPIVGDHTSKVSKAFELSYIPTYFWIDSKKVVYRRGTGGSVKALLKEFKVLSKR